MHCPYCSSETDFGSSTTSSCPAICATCSRTFRVLCTDYQSHSPSDVSACLPECRRRIGAITFFAVREDQLFCEVCGTCYTKSDGICPQLFRAIKDWYLYPMPICNRDPSLTPDRVRDEIKMFLATKLKRSVLDLAMAKWTQIVRRSARP